MSNETLIKPSETPETIKRGTDLPVVRPNYNTKQSDDSLEVGIALPGVTKDDISVDFERGVLAISAVRISKPDNSVTILRREINDTRFELRLKVADSLDTGNIAAKLENGILSLRLGVREEAKPRQIEVS